MTQYTENVIYLCYYKTKSLLVSWEKHVHEYVEVISFDNNKDI